MTRTLEHAAATPARRSRATLPLWRRLAPTLVIGGGLAVTIGVFMPPVPASYTVVDRAAPRRPGDRYAALPVVTYEVPPAHGRRRAVLLIGGATLACLGTAWLAVGWYGDWRRGHRLRHGRCPVCRYPVGSSDLCTECGCRLPLPALP